MVETTLGIARTLRRIGETLTRKTTPTLQSRIEIEDVQGVVFRGYGGLRHCSYVLLKLVDPSNARTFLRGLASQVARGTPSAATTAVQIAFSCTGLRALGLPDEILNRFSAEFITGMVDEHRSRFLGDVDESAPENWAWGGLVGPSRARRVDAVLILYADNPNRLQKLHEELKASSAAGFEEVYVLETQQLGDRDHFGFADGISQPAIDGYHSARSSLHRVKAGEFLLGYPNEYGLFTHRPLVPAAQDPLGLLPLDVEGSPSHDLGRNGTYMVLRQLRQDVAAFRQALDERTCNPDGSANPVARERLAAQMVGRWPSGASLIEAPYADDPSKAKANEFRYHREDPEGLKCPIGAHVRRSNPRDALDPHPGTEGSLAVNRRHRLIRRGRSYAVSEADRGLMFMTLNANISRQFEFVQHSWIVDPRFNGFQDEADPIAGAASANTFAAPTNPVATRWSGLPRFVTVAGGAYFFMPGVRALRFLAESTS